MRLVISMKLLMKSTTATKSSHQDMKSLAQGINYYNFIVLKLMKQEKNLSSHCKKSTQFTRLINLPMISILVRRHVCPRVIMRSSRLN